MNSENEENEFLTDRYNVISKYRSGSNLELFREFPIDYRPTPSDADYSSGFIVRYFVKKKTTNSGMIHEVSGQQFKSLSKNPFYICASLYWELVDVYSSNEKNSEQTPLSVSDINANEINEVEQTIPGLKNKLKNTLEFYKKV